MFSRFANIPPSNMMNFNESDDPIIPTTTSASTPTSITTASSSNTDIHPALTNTNPFLPSGTKTTTGHSHQNGDHFHSQQQQQPRRNSRSKSPLHHLTHPHSSHPDDHGHHHDRPNDHTGHSHSNGLPSPLNPNNPFHSYLNGSPSPPNSNNPFLPHYFASNNSDTNLPKSISLPDNHAISGGGKRDVERVASGEKDDSTGTVVVDAGEDKKKAVELSAPSQARTRKISTKSTAAGLLGRAKSLMGTGHGHGHQQGDLKARASLKAGRSTNHSRGPSAEIRNEKGRHEKLGGHKNADSDSLRIEGTISRKTGARSVPSSPGQVVGALPSLSQLEHPDTHGKAPVDVALTMGERPKDGDGVDHHRSAGKAVGRRLMNFSEGSSSTGSGEHVGSNQSTIHADEHVSKTAESHQNGKGDGEDKFKGSGGGEDDRKGGLSGLAKRIQRMDSKKRRGDQHGRSSSEQTAGGSHSISLSLPGAEALSSMGSRSGGAPLNEFLPPPGALPPNHIHQREFRKGSSLEDWVNSPPSKKISLSLAPQDNNYVADARPQGNDSQVGAALVVPEITTHPASAPPVTLSTPTTTTTTPMTGTGSDEPTPQPVPTAIPLPNSPPETPRTPGVSTGMNKTASGTDTSGVLLKGRTSTDSNGGGANKGSKDGQRLDSLNLKKSPASSTALSLLGDLHLEELDHKGLINLGNTCYCNSVIQSLSVSIPLLSVLNNAPPSSPLLHYLSPSVASPANPNNANKSSISLASSGKKLSADGSSMGYASSSSASIPEPSSPSKKSTSLPNTAPTSLANSVVPLSSVDGISPTVLPPLPQTPPIDLPLSTALLSFLQTLALSPNEFAHTPSGTRRKSSISSTKQRQGSISTRGNVSLNSGSLNPKAVLSAVGNTREEFSTREQQDAHEFLRVLLGGIECEEMDLIRKVDPPTSEVPSRSPSRQHRRSTLKPNSARKLQGRNPQSTLKPRAYSADAFSGDESDISSSPSTSSSSSSTPESDANDEESYASSDVDATRVGISSKKQRRKRKRMEKHESLYKPFVTSLFGGKLDSIIVCDDCRNVSITQEDFLDISLPLKTDDAKLRRRDKLRKSLQGGFFTKAKAEEEKKAKNPHTNAHSIRQGPQRKVSVSLSEAEETPSDTEAEHSAQKKPSGSLGRRRSLDPAIFRRKPVTAATTTGEAGTSATRSRDPSPGNLHRLKSDAAINRVGHSRPSKPPKPSHEQITYINKLLAEVPGPSIPLRWAQPGGAAKAVGVVPTPQIGVSMDQSTSGLYECLRNFTQVESLEGDNLFACHNCWKLQNPRPRDHSSLSGDKHKKSNAGGKVSRKPSPLPPVVRTHSTVLEEPSDYDPQAQPSSSVSPPDNPSDLSSERDEVKTMPSPSLSAVSSSSLPSILATTVAPTKPTRPVDKTSAPLSSSAPDGLKNLSALEADVSSAGEEDESTGSHSLATPTSLSAHALNISGLATSEPVISRPSSRASVAPSSVSFATDVGKHERKLSPRPPKSEQIILRKAHKRYLISPNSLPPVLVLQLKRFQSTSKSMFGSSFCNLKKRDDEVTFPETLDLAPFLAPREKPPGPRSGNFGWFGLKSKDKDRAMLPEVKTKYRLVSVVVHMGGMGSGHYVSYNLTPRLKYPHQIESHYSPSGQIEIPRTWVYCSDQTIRKTTIQEVLRAKAYLLFYEKVGAIEKE